MVCVADKSHDVRHRFYRSARSFSVVELVVSVVFYVLVESEVEDGFTHNHNLCCCCC